MSVAKVFLKPAAHNDLLEIGRYTEKRWGTALRREYLADIGKKLALLAANPGIGSPRDEILPGYRSAPCGRHLIFYRVMESGIEVVRILHQRMDTLPKLALEQP